jgi:hypothetical protein
VKADWSLSGGPELQNLLDALPKRWATRVVRNGTRAGAVVVQKEAKARVRRKSGKVAKGIKVSTRVDNDLIIARVRVGGEHGYVGYFLEHGVMPHLITVDDEDRPTYKTRRGVKKLSIGSINKQVKSGSLKIGEHFVGPFVHHPGHPAFPFMRPALDATAQDAVNALGEYVRSHLSWDELQAPRVEIVGDDE